MDTSEDIYMHENTRNLFSVCVTINNIVKLDGILLLWFRKRLVPKCSNTSMFKIKTIEFNKNIYIYRTLPEHLILINMIQTVRKLLKTYNSWLRKRSNYMKYNNLIIFLKLSINGRWLIRNSTFCLSKYNQVIYFFLFTRKFIIKSIIL